MSRLPTRLEGDRGGSGGGDELHQLRIDRSRERPGRGRLVTAAAVAVAALARATAGLFVLRSPARARIETAVARGHGGRQDAAVSATGYVEAATKADLASSVTARVLELRVSEGSHVKAGEVVARLDPGDLAARIEAARASLGLAQAQFRRQESLWQSGLVPRSLFDADAERLAVARANLTALEALMDQTIIRAPFDGVVTAKHAEVGESVSPFDRLVEGAESRASLMTIVDFASLYVGADVNEKSLPSLAVGDAADIVLTAFPERRYRGRLTRVLPAVDRNKGTVKVEVAFLDRDDRILPGLSARIGMPAGGGPEDAGAVRVPASAVTARDGRSGVFVVESGRARFRAVELGARAADEVAVARGLADGEVVVRDATRADVSDGAAVEAAE